MPELKEGERTPMDTIESLRAELAAERGRVEYHRNLATSWQDTAEALRKERNNARANANKWQAEAEEAVAERDAIARDLAAANARLAEVERATVAKCVAWLEADATAAEESLCQDQPITEMARQVVDAARVAVAAQLDTAREMRIALMPAQASEERPNHGECCAYCHGSGVDRRGNFCGTNTRALMPVQASEPATGGEG